MFASWRTDIIEQFSLPADAQAIKNIELRTTSMYNFLRRRVIFLLDQPIECWYIRRTTRKTCWKVELLVLIRPWKRRGGLHFGTSMSHRKSKHSYGDWPSSLLLSEDVRKHRHMSNIDNCIFFWKYRLVDALFD